MSETSTIGEYRDKFDDHQDVAGQGKISQHKYAGVGTYAPVDRPAQTSVRWWSDDRPAVDRPSVSGLVGVSRSSSTRPSEYPCCQNRDAGVVEQHHRPAHRSFHLSGE